MKKQNFLAFTLVELIVVITILAILSTVAFISYSWYGSTSRDSVRLTDLANIEKSFELLKIAWKDFPMPTNKIDISSSGTVFQYQGELSSSILEWSLWIYDGWFDPQTKQPYIYSTNTARNKFQVLSFLENKNEFVKINNHNIYANNVDKFPQTRWDTLGILLDEITFEPIQKIISDTQIDISTTTQNFWVIMNKQIETGDKTLLAKIVNLNKYGFAKSCKELLDENSDLQDNDGIYTLSYNKTEIYDVYCDMTTDWWGWTSIISIADNTHFTFKATSPSSVVWSAATTDEQKNLYLNKVEELNNSIFNFTTLGNIWTIFSKDTILNSYNYVGWNEIMFADENNQFLTYDFTAKSLSDYYIWVKYNEDNQVLPVKKTNISTDVNNRWDLSLQMIWEDWDSAMYNIYHWSGIWPYFNAANNGNVDFDDAGYSVFYKKLGWKLNPIVSDYVIWYVR